MAKDRRLEEEILSVIREMLGRKVSLEDKIEDIPEWDSLKYLQIVLEIEDRFKINVPMDVVMSIDNVKELVEFVVNSCNVK